MLPGCVATPSGTTGRYSRWSFKPYEPPLAAMHDAGGLRAAPRPSNGMAANSLTTRRAIVLHIYISDTICAVMKL